jgi:uncharacterized protein (TIGR01777 family)
MRVIITGGAGMVGSALTRNLAAAGHEVIALSRSPEQHAARMPPGARVEQWDGRTPEGWGHLADGAEAIINMAGESIAGKGLIPSRWTAARKARIRDSRLAAGRAVMAAIQAARVKPKLLIQQSAVGYYGHHGAEALPESTPPGQDFLARVAVEWEQSTQPAEALGVRRVVSRTGVRLLAGPGGFLRPLKLVFSLFLGGPMGSGKQYWPWIHPADEIAALRWFMANEQASGVYNMAAPNPETNRDFSRVFGKVVGRPSFFPAPAFGVRLVLGELADALILNGQRAVPQRLLEAGFKFKYATLEPALRDVLK